MSAAGSTLPLVPESLNTERDLLALASVEDVAVRCGRNLPHIAAARVATRQRLEVRRQLLADVDVDEDVAVVMMGSWGRFELTRESDDDYMVLVRGDRDGIRPTVDAVAERFERDPKGFRRPGTTDTFGVPVSSVQLVRHIGLEEDTNRNLTRRSLLMLESVAVCNDDVHRAARADVVEGYLSDARRSFSPPRFLLNDIVRFWRTMGVDFVAKIRQGKEWGVRNAKLRTSRKLLFASGLLPVLRCHELPVDQMPGFLLGQLERPPLDRLADAFLHYGRLEESAQVLVAYDQFLSLLDDPATRSELASLSSGAQARNSRAFATVAELGREIDAGLLGLLFSPALARWTREFGLL